MRAAAIALVLALAVGACSALPGMGPAPDMYTLTPKSTFAAALPKVEWQLLVEEPFAASGLDTNRIAIAPAPLELRYYGEARWTDRAPRMVQTLLIESFENSGRIVSVGRQSVGLRADYILKTEMREFQAELAGGATQVRVRLNAKLIRQPRQEIVGSENFEAVVAARSDAPGAVVQAFDDALGAVMKRLVEWSITRGQAARS